MPRSHPETRFVARLSEESVVKAEARKVRRRTEVHREPFLPTTQIHGLRSPSQPKGGLG